VAADLAAIARIEATAFEPSRRSSARSLERALASTFQRVLVAELDGALAGYLIYWPYRHTWRIYNLATDAAFRNRGVAGALLAAAVDRARAAGARRVVLESRESAALLDYYAARGFRAEKCLPDYYAKGEAAVRMALELPPAPGGSRRCR
jgi:ribosomal protein S18 acetylase RimI-like enzyme